MAFKLNPITGKLDYYLPNNEVDHSLLLKLDYASSGHSGFEPTVTKGNLTELTSSVLTIGGGTGSVIGSGITIQVKQSSSLQSGYLSSTDWNTFNNKQNALSLGNLTAASSKISIGGTGTGAVIGTGASVDLGTVNLDDLADVIIATPTLDQILKYNGADWINGQQTTVNGGSGVDFFYVETASDIGGYYTLSRTPDSGGELDETVVCNNNKVLLDAYASPSTGLGGTQIDAGVWTFDIWGYVSDVSLTSEIIIDIYKRTAGGSETLLFSVSSGEINMLSVSLYSITSVQQAFAINATDRLIAKVSGQTNRILDTTIHFFHGGITHYSHFNTPLVVRHNDLAGLQGGTSDQYYHLTSAQYTIATQAATTALSGYLTSTDWNTFNGKQNALTTGNLTATSPIALDQTRQVIGGAAVISHLTTAGNIHLPTGGSVNQILKNSGVSGTGSWGTVTENAGALAAITTLSMSGQLTNTLAIGTAPFAVTSTTVNTNLNADMLDGKHVGTSGNAVPLLDGANTWSGLNSYSAGIYISSTSEVNMLAIGNSYAAPKFWIFYDSTATYPKIKWNAANEVGLQLGDTTTGPSDAPLLTGLDVNDAVVAIYINKALRVRAFSDATDSLVYLDNSVVAGLGGMAFHPNFAPVALEIYTQTADIIIQPDAANGFKTEVNYDKGDCDFVIHGDTVDNVFFMEASKNRIGLGTNAPKSYLHQYPSDAGAASGTIPQGSVPAAPVEGDYWNDNKQLCSMNFTNGMAQSTVGCIFTQTASVTVNNTATERTLIGAGIGTLTLPANALAIGKTIRIMASGYYSFIGTLAQTLTFRIRLGGIAGTIVLATGVNPAAAIIANRSWRIDAEITCRTLGALGTVFSQGMVTLSTTAVLGTVWDMMTAITSAINTTVAQAIVVTADWNGAVAGDTITCTNLTVELLN